MFPLCDETSWTGSLRQCSHVWLFEGAEPGDIVNIIDKRYGGQPGPVESEVEDESEPDSVKDRSKKARTK